MQAFTKLTGLVAPLDRVNVDTDQIIPKQFLKRIERTGFGEFAFFDWRYLEDGVENPDFILNQPKYRSASILVSGRNFGSGSSREHAPIALSHSGIKSVLALSFARIFYRNAVDGAFLLPIEIDEDAYHAIAEGNEIEIDISSNTITNITKNQTYKMKPFSEIIGKIIAAGGLFKYNPDEE